MPRIDVHGPGRSLARFLVVLAFAGLFGALSACARGGEADRSIPGDPAGRPGGAEQPGQRVVLFGVDGADWMVIDPLIAAGRMPHLARIVREGASGVLTSMEPSASPSLWTTVATGVTPDVHGIHGFVVPGDVGGVPSGLGEAGHEAHGGTRGGGAAGGRADVRPVTSTMRRAPAFWNILGRYERKSGIVGWLVTWPAEPINGFMVSSYLPYLYNWSTGRPLKGTVVEGIPHQTFPEGLIDEVESLKVRPDDLDPALVASFYDPAAVEGLLPGERECVTGFRWSLACDETYRRVARHLFERYPVDLFAVYFGGIDVASHRFWKFANPGALDYAIRPSDGEVLGRVIDSYYEYIDRALGEYIADLGPSDTIIVLSDHGFKPVWNPARPATSGHHRPEGILALWGRGVARGRRIDSARLVDVLPTLLVLLDVPLATSLEGHPIEDALEPGFLALHTPRVVPDYGPAAVPAGPDASDVDANVVERLRSLGYID